MEISLSERDQRVIWHPYTQHQTMMPPVAIVRGEGALLFDEKGKQYIDAISSWWVNIHGHADISLAEKIYAQAKKFSQVIFTGFTHEPAILLAERLLKILPGKFDRIFYSDNGSTAVEVALKMGIQYWWNTRKNRSPDAAQRKTILALHNSYHGDTFGAMSLSERGVFTLPFAERLFDVKFIDVPTEETIDHILGEIEPLAESLACFIYEPLLQGAGGMQVYPPAALNRLLAVLKAHQVICIADEVFTGFGRTGKLFAGDYVTEKPDIICLSKGLTGGSMALGVTACTKKIFEAFLDADRSKTLFHGHSFTANPLACAASLGSLDLVELPQFSINLMRISTAQENFAKKMRTQPLVSNVRTLGTLLAFEINIGNTGYLNSLGTQVTALAMECGIYLRPLGNTLYFLPPYCITDHQLSQVHDFLYSVADRIN